MVRGVELALIQKLLATRVRTRTGCPQELHVRHEPRIVADDMILVLQSTLQGLGITQLPLPLCFSEICSKYCCRDFRHHRFNFNSCFHRGTECCRP
jgi:hypothetical protein